MSNPTFGQMVEFHKQAEAGRVTGENLQRFIENPDRYNESLGKFGRVYTLEVNYDLGVDRLVKANQFAWKSDDVTAANFPTERKGVRVVKVELYEFDETVTGEDAVKRIEADGYQVEDACALLTFGKSFPIEQLRRPIAGLGSHWTDRVGDVYAPYLDDSSYGKRVLCLYDVASRFDPDWRFLVSRKES